MTSQWKNIAIGTAAAVLVFAGGFFTSQTLPAAPQKLMLVTAASLTASEMDADVQRIQISDVNTTATWFTDRPNRMAGQAGTDELLTEFFTDYPTDPPNVTISMLVDGTAVTRVVTLSRPQWDGKTLSFDSTPLTNDSLGTLPTKASNISITVDNYCTSSSSCGSVWAF